MMPSLGYKYRMLFHMSPNQLQRQKTVNADMQGVMILWLGLNYYL